MAGSSCSSVIALTPSLCSTFISRGTSNARILRYTPGWLRATFSIAFLPSMTEVQQQRLHELLVQQMTCTVPVAVRVARNPLLERHVALHVGRVVLNVNKCLIGLQNLLMQIGLRSEW